MADDSILDNILADSDSPTAFGNGELMAQARRLAMRKAQLEADAIAAARQTGRFAAPSGTLDTGGFTSAVTGTPIVGIQQKRPLLSGLSGLIADSVHGAQQDQFERDESGYNRIEREAARRLIDEMPRTQEAPGPYGVAVKTEPTREERLAWAQRAAQVPSLKNLADSYAADLLIKEPERVEAREERKLTREEARAEAQRKQAEDLKWRTWQQNQHNQTLAAIAAGHDAARRGGGSGGGAGGGSGAAGLTFTDENGNEVPGWARKNVKASDIVKDVAPDGSVTLTDKLTGQRLKVGGGGAQSGTHQKSQAEAAQGVANAEKALDLLDQMSALIPKATSSGAGAVRDKVLGVAGISTKAGDAAGELDQMGKKLVSYIDRKGLGPQFSDADIKFLSATSGGLGDPTVPVSRKLAVYERVRRQFEAQAKGEPPTVAVPGSTILRAPSREASGKVTPSSGGTVKWGDLK